MTDRQNGKSAQIANGKKLTETAIGTAAERRTFSPDPIQSDPFRSDRSKEEASDRSDLY
jgi:hypothetical protein